VPERNAISPEVSVIVIAFNEERRIGPCLDALLSQSADAVYEVIVVDDGSHDETADAVKQHQRRHQNLRLISHPINRGRGAARRTGQDASDSAFVAFVDADIVVPSNWLRRCLEELASASGVSGIAQPDGDCAVIWRLSQATLRERPGSAEITGNNLMLSRDALAQVPFSSTARLGEDFRLAKLMKQKGLQLRTLSDLKVEHRETKTYWQSISWMWKSGVDATLLLFEFRVVRLPDLAWAIWLAGCCVLVATAVLEAVSVGFAIALMVALTVMVAISFVVSRFRSRPHPYRFLAALALSPPLMLAYLVGRSAGLPLVPFRLRRPI
jgi:glycosyltransferase involved in cell wall biosynthesis